METDSKKGAFQTCDSIRLLMLLTMLGPVCGPPGATFLRLERSDGRKRINIYMYLTTLTRRNTTVEIATPFHEDSNARPLQEGKNIKYQEV